VERTGSETKAVVVHFADHVAFMTEDTAQVLGRALQQVGFGEKTRLVVFEETATRPAGIF
jgi:hypothetical protein